MDRKTIPRFYRTVDLALRHRHWRNSHYKLSRCLYNLQWRDNVKPCHSQDPITCDLSPRSRGVALLTVTWRHIWSLGYYHRPIPVLHAYAFEVVICGPVLVLRYLWWSSCAWLTSGRLGLIVPTNERLKPMTNLHIWPWLLSAWKM